MSRRRGSSEILTDETDDVTRFLSGGEMDALMKDENFEPYEVREGPRLGEARKQENEINRLRSQLEAATAMIKSIATRGTTASGSKKRVRSGSDVDSSALSRDADQDEESPAYHPAEARADRLQTELEEQKLLRQQDKNKSELLLGNADSTNKKLLRQVKFLSEEEEEARAEYSRKQEAFLAETAKLQEQLRAERAARARSSKEGGRLGQLERERLERRIGHEVMERKVAEGRITDLERQANGRAAEVTAARKERRNWEAEKSRLSRELSALRREKAEVASTPLGDEDTPVARDLRAKIRVMERQARRWERSVQEMEVDGRNAALLEEKAQSLEAKLKRSEAALEKARQKEAEHAATEEEKEQWSILFSKAIKEEKNMENFKRRGAEEEGGTLENERAQGDGAIEEKVTPLAALRLLRDVQEEKSAMVEELTMLRLRQKDSSERLEQSQTLIKEKQEQLEAANTRTTDLQLELDNVQRRCCTAEKEVVAQKELIESYERDVFRRPTDSWVADHSRLDAALKVAKTDAQSLRQSLESRVSAEEASRLRIRAEQAEAELLTLAEERKVAMRNLERAEQELAGIKGVASEDIPGAQYKVVHLRRNPFTAAREHAKAEREKEFQNLKDDNARLVKQLESAGAGSMDASMSVLHGEAPDATKYSQRLKEAYKERINYYREAIYLLTGYKVDLVKDPTRQVLRLRSMYAEHEEDSLVFHQVDYGLELVETPFAKDNMGKVDSYLGKFHSIPAFLSSLTLELFEKQTFMPRPF